MIDSNGRHNAASAMELAAVPVIAKNTSASASSRARMRSAALAVRKSEPYAPQKPDAARPSQSMTSGVRPARLSEAKSCRNALCAFISRQLGSRYQPIEQAHTVPARPFRAGRLPGIQSPHCRQDIEVRPSLDLDESLQEQGTADCCAFHAAAVFHIGNGALQLVFVTRRERQPPERLVFRLPRGE